MNQRFSILFCALLASTFVHELRAKGLGPVNPAALEAANHVELGRVKRSSSRDLDLTIEVIADLLVISNTSSDAILAINVSANLFVLLNGTTGSGVAIDSVNDKGAYFSKGLWKAEEESLKDFLESLKDGLSGLLECNESESFNCDSVTKTILKEVRNIVVDLVATLDDELQEDLSLALELVLSIVDGIVEKFCGVLDGLLDLIGDKEICIYVDICGLLNVLQGLATVIELTCEDIETCEKKHVEFDAEELLGAKNGLEALTNLLRQLGACVDLSCLKDLLGNVESLFSLIAQLGGNFIIGINGVFRVVAKIAALINGNTELVIVISEIVQYVAYSSECVDKDLTHEFKELLEELLEVLEEADATECLSDLVKIIEDLIEGKLEIDGCNLSDIIEKLLKGISDRVNYLLVLIIEILLLLEPIVSCALTIPYLLLVLITDLNCAYGVYLLKIIGIEISIGVFLGGILSSIGNLSFLLVGNLYAALCGFPIIGNIILALDYAVEEASNRELRLKDLFDDCNPVQTLILGLIQCTSDVVLEISTTVVTEVEVILKSVTSILAFVSVEVSVIVNVSA